MNDTNLTPAMAPEHAYLRDLAAAFSIPGPLARKIQAVAAILRRRE